MWNLTHVGSGGSDSCNGAGSSAGTTSNQQAASTPNGGHNGSGGAAPSSSDAYPHLSHLASIDSFDSRWYVSLQNLMSI